MKKNILFISPAFANKGVIWKYDKRYIEALSTDFSFAIATKKCNPQLTVPYTPIFSSYIPTKIFQILKFRYLNDIEFIVPDLFRISINPFLYRKCKDYIQNNKVDYIHTICFPCSSNLIGYKLKKKFNIPWIAQFYDPWIGNPFRNIPPKLKLLDESLEQLVANNADIIIHSNNIIKRQWITRYGDHLKNKIYTIPFCYSTEQISRNLKSNNIKQTEKRIISYIGTCAGDRNLQSVIKAVHIFTNYEPELRNKLEIRILGNLLPIDQHLIENYKIKDIIKFVGRIPSDQLDKYYLESDIFLVIDSPNIENIFFPSKLLDYFLYSKPILGISPKIGITNELLTKSNNTCIENHDVISIYKYFKQAIIDWQSLQNFDKDFYKNFSPECIAKQFNSIINNLL